MKNTKSIYDVKLKIGKETFSGYVADNLIRDCQMYQVKKALWLYLNTKNQKELDKMLADNSIEKPVYFEDDPDMPETRYGLIQYAYDMLNGEYDFPEDYLDTELSVIPVTDFGPDDEPFRFFDYKKMFNKSQAV